MLEIPGAYSSQPHQPPHGLSPLSPASPSLSLQMTHSPTQYPQTTCLPATAGPPLWPLQSTLDTPQPRFSILLKLSSSLNRPHNDALPGGPEVTATWANRNTPILLTKPMSLGVLKYPPLPEGAHFAGSLDIWYYFNLDSKPPLQFNSHVLPRRCGAYYAETI
jgi:hypothetical protein